MAGEAEDRDLPRRVAFALAGLAAAAFVLRNLGAVTRADWVPFHDTLAQYSEFLYAYASWRAGELPLWNSYLYGGQPFYLLLNHALLLNPVAWLWIGTGDLLDLTPRLAFVLGHLTDAFVLALGGAVLAFELFRSRASAVTAFVLLLFSAQTAYWTRQIYDLSTVEFAPWAAWAAVRYVSRQTLGRALAVAFWAALAANVYYPVYLATFAVTATALWAAVYPGSVRRVDWRAALRHGAAALPVAAALLLPTFLSYLEITGDFVQPARENAARVPAIGYASSLAALGRLARETVRTVDAQHECTVLVGMAGATLAILGLLGRRTRRASIYWLLLSGALALHRVQFPPVQAVGRLTVPFYGIIQSPGYFAGFVALGLALAASLGARSLLGCTDSGGANLRRKWVPLALPSLLWAVFAPVLPGIQAALAGSVAALLTLHGVVAAREGPRGFRWALFGGALLLGSVGPSALIDLSRSAPVNEVQFRQDREFSFSFLRPPGYAATNSLPSDPGVRKTSFTFYQIGQRLDGPYHLGSGERWHVLFVGRNYHSALTLPGFPLLAEKKLHFFRRYELAGTPRDFNRFLDRGVLALPSDRQVRGRHARQEVGEAGLGSKPAIFARLRAKTANRVVFDVRASADGFLVYTDLYHDGFHAYVDGAEVPILRGMGLFKAVELGAGTHAVEFAFRPGFRFVLVGYLAAVSAFLAIQGAGAARERVREVWDGRAGQD